MRNNQRRAENEAAYEKQLIERERREAEFERNFGSLERRIEELGIDLYQFKEWLKAISE